MFATAEPGATSIEQSIQGFAVATRKAHGLERFELTFWPQHDLRLDRIVVPAEAQGKGHGTAALAELIAFADTHQYRLVLDPAGFLGTQRLIKFYGRFGFVQNKGRSFDRTIGESMYRLPAAHGQAA